MPSPQTPHQRTPELRPLRNSSLPTLPIPLRCGTRALARMRHLVYYGPSMDVPFLPRCRPERSFAAFTDD